MPISRNISGPRAWRKLTTDVSRSAPAAVPGLRDEVGGRAGEQLLAVGEDEQARAVARGLGDVVRREDDGAARLEQPVDDRPEARALARVERRGRLVEQQHGRVGEQADRDVHPLAVAAGERGDRDRRARSSSPVSASIRRTASAGCGTFSSCANSRRFSSTVSRV